MAAIVVGGIDQGEANRIVRLLSADRGRISVMARHARASRKRFAGLLDPGTRIKASVKKGRGSLLNLTDCDLVSSPNKARTELERISLLAYGCELAAALAPEEAEAVKLFTLLHVWLDLLEGETCPGHASRVAFEAKALTFAGLAPVLDRCVVCGEPEPTCLDLEAGGGVHEHCGTGRFVGDLAALEVLRRTPLAETLDRDVDEDARWVLTDFIEHQLAKGLKSRAMLELL